MKSDLSLEKNSLSKFKRKISKKEKKKGNIMNLIKVVLKLEVAIWKVTQISICPVKKI